MSIALSQPKRFKPIDWLTPLLLVIMVVTMVINGTYLRVRDAEEESSVDWVVLVRLLAGAAGMAAGLLALLQGSPMGPVTKTLIAWSGCALFSMLFTPHRVQVFGYALMLMGCVLMTAGLVSRAKDKAALERVEAVWLGTVVIILLKDFFFLTLMAAPQLDPWGVARMGLRLVHPNALSNMAVLAFWVMLGRYRALFSGPFCAFFVLLVLRARTRTSMAGLFIGAGIWLWYQLRPATAKAASFRALIPLGYSAGISFVLVATLLGAPGTGRFVSFINRGQSVEYLTQLTGRAAIWPVVVEKTFDEQFNMLFGHGYGISRIPINEGGGKNILTFDASHAHNTFLEVLITTGIFGLIAFSLFLLGSSQWFFRFRRLERVFGLEFSLRAVCVTATLFLSTMTEIYICGRVHPIMMLFFFYALVLDKRWYFERVAPPKPEPV